MIVHGRNEADVAAVAAELPNAVGIAAEVSDLDAVRELCRRAQEAVGTVDVLVNNAGLSTRTAITRLTDEEWERSLGVNLTGPMYLIRELVPGMKQAGWGRIVNVTSGAGVHGVPGFSAYSAAKGGIVGLSLTLALELARFGIKVNALVARRAHRHAAPAPTRAARPDGRGRAPHRRRLRRHRTRPSSSTTPPPAKSSPSNAPPDIQPASAAGSIWRLLTQVRCRGSVQLGEDFVAEAADAFERFA